MEKREINFKYINEKRLGFCDFIELIREDLLKNISKNRGFIHPNRNPNVYFFIEYGDNKHIIYYADEKFGLGGICVDNFCKELLKEANVMYYGNICEYAHDRDFIYYDYVPDYDVFCNRHDYDDEIYDYISKYNDYDYDSDGEFCENFLF